MRIPRIAVELAAAMLLALVLASPALGQSEGAPPSGPPPSSTWTFAVEPYIWLIGIDGTLAYEIPSRGDDGGADVGLSLEDLKFAFMMSGEARRGDWAIVADFAYASLESSHDTVETVRFPGPGGRVEVDVAPNSETSTELTATEWMLAGSRTIVRGKKSAMDVLFGVRSLAVEAESEWQLSGEVQGPGASQSFDRQGSVSERVHLWDAIVGLRGELSLGGKWFVPYHADFGAGSSKLTWQAVTGVAYRFSWGDLRLAYRYLRYDMKDDDLVQNVQFSGFGVAARFRF